jgi:hypothetical protein
MWVWAYLAYCEESVHLWQVLDKTEKCGEKRWKKKSSSNLFGVWRSARTQQESMHFLWTCHDCCGAYYAS